MVIHKDLRPRTYFFTQMKIVLVFFLLFFGVEAFAQCDSKISIVGKKEVAPGDNSGSIKIQIESSVSYTLTLISRVDVDRSENVTEKQHYKGSGNQSFTFTGLAPDKFYSVSVEFASDSREICKKRMTKFFEVNKNKDLE